MKKGIKNLWDKWGWIPTIILAVLVLFIGNSDTLIVDVPRNDCPQVVDSLWLISSITSEDIILAVDGRFFLTRQAAVDSLCTMKTRAYQEEMRKLCGGEK